MRLLGLALCLVACTLENPAFFVEPPGSDAGTDPTRPGPGTTALTTGPEHTTGDPGLTATGSATADPMTTTGEPGDTDTGPAMCDIFADQLGPRVRLTSYNNQQPLDQDACAELQQSEYHGILIADLAKGFTIKKGNCGVDNDIPFDGLHVALPLPVGPVANNACVSFSFTAHPGDTGCALSGFEVRQAGVPVIWGSFGRSELPLGLPLEVEVAATGTCVCADCCPDAPDPDLYKLIVETTEVDEDSSAQLVKGDHKYFVTNMRSHVHGSHCQGGLPRADWLHFDWLVSEIF